MTTIDLTALPPPPASSVGPDQKRTEVDSTQSSSILAQISTWEVPSDILPEEEPTAASIPRETTPVLIDLLDDPASPSPSRAYPTEDDTFTDAPQEPLSAYTCPICFSPPTNATLTPCGHICCGQCLFTAVKSTMRRNMVVAMDRAPAATSVQLRCSLTFLHLFPLNTAAPCVAQRYRDGTDAGVG